MRPAFPPVSTAHVAASRRPSKAPVVLEALDPYPPRPTRLEAAQANSDAEPGDTLSTTRASHRTRLSGRQAALGRLQAREARAMMRDARGD